jgi:glucose/mannose-6-phosphate isomerase
MRDIILNFPKQFAAGIAAAKDTELKRAYSRIICCGMGGSAVPGEIISMIRHDVVVHWDYDLPATAGKDDLVLCTSWSGGTEETISSYEKARALGLDVIAVTKGGELAERAKANGTQLVLLPNEDIPPRTAAGYMTGALMKLIGSESELDIQLQAAGTEELGKSLAEKISTKVPLVYTSYPLRKLAGFWKIFFNENAKVPSFANWAPSMVHNELAGFESKTRDQFIPIVLRDPAETVDHRRNLDALLAIFDKMSYNYITVQLSSNTKVLEKVFENYILGLWTSYYLAKNLGTDPANTELIEEFKKLKASK